MFISSIPMTVRKVEKISIPAGGTLEYDTNSYNCIMQVISGSAYITGEEDKAPTAEKYKMSANAQIEFKGKLLIYAETAADIRILYYEYV